MAQYLGPLELLGDRWVIGDPSREAGLFFVLTPEGLEHRQRGEAEPLSTVKWAKFVGLGVRATYHHWQTSAASGFFFAGSPNYDAGRDGCSLGGRVRGQYDDWSVRYTHHIRSYGVSHVILLKALFAQLSDAKALDRLGDPAWLGAAVTELSPYTSWYVPKGNRLVKKTIETLGT
ncbi:hypothetical protein OHS33_34680 [Streptomyces sp. NBC_00536]|uniref:hypothetical protein n=1 Tax=Streptomyces sp. NBC_00536 TaxID=2975769 RepID=UPI002E80E611|nr:hypothetical protein [Streptomyces sp. NBC_00536]WUC83066.1 hypothetical protein OHS33_34680 [Streptomyces sp. NBC_00536]